MHTETGSEEELWIDDFQPIEELQATVRPFLARPIVEMDPVWNSSIRLLSVGKDRVEVIRLVRDLGGLSLQNAKSFVDELPQYLKVNDTRDASYKLTMAGAKVEEPPNKDDARWTTFRIDRRMFDSTCLVLSESVEFWAHVHSTRGGARGMISVLPRDQTLPLDYVPNNKNSNRLEIANAVSGDGSLNSYWQAAILFRELDEVGAEWHGVSWRAHSLLDKAPDESWTLQGGWLEHAECLRQRYSSGFRFSYLRPRLKRTANGEVWVDFFTLNPVGTRTIVYHSDHFHERYRSNTFNFTCAKGDIGYVH
jgi:ribosomal protein L7/L12